MNENLLEISNISKGFVQPNKTKLMILNDLNLKIEKGTITAITGVSGSGKSTLLHLIGGLDKPDSGYIEYNGKRLNNFSKKEMSNYRNQEIGFVYQFHYLLPELKIIENIAFPFLMNSFNKDEAFRKAKKLLAYVGIEDKADNMPFQLSGGERQRVAIARSLINMPSLLLADEPTGNLDFKTGQKIFFMFKDLIKNSDLTAIIVTHNEELAKLTDYIYNLNDGDLVPVV